MWADDAVAGAVPSPVGEVGSPQHSLSLSLSRSLSLSLRASVRACFCVCELVLLDRVSGFGFRINKGFKLEI